MCPLPHNWWRWGGSLCTPQLARRGIYVPPTPQLGSLSVPPTTGRGEVAMSHPPPQLGPLFVPPTLQWGGPSLCFPPHNWRGGGGPYLRPPTPALGWGDGPYAAPPPKKKPKPQYGGGEGGPCFRYPNDLGKGAGGFPGNSKAPPPKSHAHTHPRAHPRTRRAPPPPALVLGWGGGIKTFVSDRVPTPSPPPPTLWGRSGGGGGDTSSSSSSSSTPPQAFLGGGANLMISSSEGCRMMSVGCLGSVPPTPAMGGRGGFIG